MIEKNMDNPEISTKLMDALRRGYSGRSKTAVNDCPLSGDAIAYAFKELAPDAHQKVEDHLQSCRACMNLVLDARAAEIESQELAGEPAKVLPALADAINRPQKRSFMEKLAAGFRIPALYPKIVAAAAMAGLAFIIINHGLKDPETNLTIRKVTDKAAPLERKKIPHAETKPQAGSNQGIQKQPLSMNTITADERKLIDPFEPSFRDKPDRVPVLKKRKKRVPRTPLEALDPSQLKLVGVMLSDKGNTALLEDASGKGYVIRKGSYIGMNAGKVVQILKDRVIIEEQIEDIHGKIIVQKREIQLHKP
jgi:type IV pilus assembly protein PilP